MSTFDEGECSGCGSTMDSIECFANLSCSAKGPVVERELWTLECLTSAGKRPVRACCWLLPSHSNCVLLLAVPFPSLAHTVQSLNELIDTLAAVLILDASSSRIATVDGLLFARVMW